MEVSKSISRLVGYFRRHGISATVRRAGLSTRRALFSSRMVLFYCDLHPQSLPIPCMSSSLEVERKRHEGELGSRDLEEITSFWNPKLARRNIKERFGRGAVLWLIKSEGRLMGYGWTLQGHTVEPHYVCLAPDDIHLFDFHVFPQYRGRGVNPLLVRYILGSLSAESRGRAFIEVAEWNQAQLASLRMTPFRRLGSARKFTFFRRTAVYWDADNKVKEQSNELRSASVVRSAARRTASQTCDLEGICAQQGQSVTEISTGPSGPMDKAIGQPIRPDHVPSRPILLTGPP